MQAETARMTATAKSRSFWNCNGNSSWNYNGNPLRPRELATDPDLKRRVQPKALQLQSGISAVSAPIGGIRVPTLLSDAVGQH
jgi:hypothetical protein